MRVAIRRALLALAMLAPTGAVLAQGNYPDLAFPTEASELSAFSPIAMGIWKPAGDGPFPALIIAPSCGGMKQQIGYWRAQAVKRGYAAFVVDFFGPRGAKNCRPIPMARGVKDVLDAAAHLKTLPFVDKAKIATVGFSWGAMAGLLGGSPKYISEVAPGRDRLAASVTLYPACYIGPFGTFPGNEYLRPDIATPTLLLLGGRDNETPADECLSRLPAHKERNAPVEWHLFKEMTHCWDCSDQHNQRWSPPWAGGRQVVYEYDSAATEESVQRAFDFLGRRLGLEKKQ